MGVVRDTFSLSYLPFTSNSLTNTSTPVTSLGEAEPSWFIDGNKAFRNLTTLNVALNANFVAMQGDQSFAIPLHPTIIRTEFFPGYTWRKNRADCLTLVTSYLAYSSSTQPTSTSRYPLLLTLIDTFFSLPMPRLLCFPQIVHGGVGVGVWHECQCVFGGWASGQCDDASGRVSILGRYAATKVTYNSYLIRCIPYCNTLTYISSFIAFSCDVPSWSFTHSRNGLDSSYWKRVITKFNAALKVGCEA